MKKILLSTLLFASTVLAANAQVLKTDFLSGYSVGQSLEKSEYESTTQGETNPIQIQWNLTGKRNSATDLNISSGESPVIAAPLEYEGYADSGKDYSIQLARFATTNTGRMSVYSLSNKSEYSGDVFYLTAIVKFTQVASTGGADFLTFDSNYTGSTQRARVFVKNGSDSDKFTFGLSENASSPTVTTGDFNKGDSCLIVLKYDFLNATNGIKLFVNPDLTATEPATSTQVDIASALSSIRGIVIRQRATLEGQIGGIRFANTWADALGQNATGINDNVVDNGNIVSTKYYNLSGIEVNEPVNTNSIYIKKDVYENGSVKATKVVR